MELPEHLEPNDAWRDVRAEPLVIFPRLIAPSLFDRYGVDLVVCGHEHHYERSHPIRGVSPNDTLTPIPVATDLSTVDTSPSYCCGMGAVIVRSSGTRGRMRARLHISMAVSRKQ